MTKVSVHERASPSAELLAAAKQPVEFTDPQGRRIVLVKPGLLAQTRLAKVLGAELAANTTYVQLIQPLLYIQSIDGHDVPFPQSDREIEALFSRLEEAAYVALAQKINEVWGAADPEADRAEIKK